GKFVVTASERKSSLVSFASLALSYAFTTNCFFASDGAARLCRFRLYNKVFLGLRRRNNEFLEFSNFF
ncbi:hypothetical protein ACTQ2R_05335, partial [Hallella faecis]|uniref:hypothetical protein n=1 Tax=Hallella faecis TaxID=2841596 RepID=UPI003F8EA78E